MKLALGLEVYNKAVLDLPIEAIETAERYGYHSVWTAEAYGSDALSTLAYLAGKTRTIKLGTAVVQVAASLQSFDVAAVSLPFCILQLRNMFCSGLSPDICGAI